MLFARVRFMEIVTKHKFAHVACTGYSTDYNTGYSTMIIGCYCNNITINSTCPKTARG